VVSSWRRGGCRVFLAGLGISTSPSVSSCRGGSGWVCCCSVVEAFEVELPSGGFSAAEAAIPPDHKVVGQPLPYALLQLGLLSSPRPKWSVPDGDAVGRAWRRRS
jgi:hypothetical protein